MTIISPSVLSADFYNLASAIKDINESAAEWIHYDVMDGHFVPNLTFGPDILKVFSKHSDKLLDVHIMVSNPMQVVDYFKDLNIHMLTFHYEAVNDNTMLPMIGKCRSRGYKVGISIKPKTDPAVLKDVLHMVDMVLVMSVEPGFGGQKFMPEALDKLDWLHEYRQQHDLHYLLQIDGGINYETGKLAVEHHCDVLVTGSYVFRHPDGFKAGVESLL
ncbi:MAG: ribulose-phosphate 3-epimerase [Erysipelotrichaceae bacterium]|nr:ribulose-phosphate 3-epimerase [Erysipelotrichaceae bacterium]